MLLDKFFECRKVQMRAQIQSNFREMTISSPFQKPFVILHPYLSKTILVCILADSGFFKNCLYQGGVKSTVSRVFEELKFKISEGYDQFWSEPS